MPKGKRRAKTSGAASKNRIEALGTSDEDSMNDNASVISLLSDSTIHDDGGNFGDELAGDEPSQEDLFEEKLYEAIDGISEKSAQGRTNSLLAVGTAFTRRYVPHLIIDRRMTLADGIERALKKGRGAEQAAAAQLAALLCIQLGACDVTNHICHQLVPTLTHIATDTSMAPLARAKCCWALGVLNYIGDTDDTAGSLVVLQQVFAGSYPKGDGSQPTVTADTAQMHAAALSAWSLLLTVTDSHHLPSLAQLATLLQSPHLEVRMAAGEAIVLLVEQERDTSNSCDDLDDQLVDQLRDLATDSHKYRAKKDRKTQRSSFRDILRYVEEDEPPNIQIKFGKEMLTLDTWSRKKQYDVLCQVLGSGMNLHLVENDLLRDILQLGERISPLNLSAHKQSKLERHLMNAANFKARSISRAKNRDKRTAVI
ncbi:interferon-related developmental regulator 2 [Nilaparvata lugens]|uniref:interferon-related developmental regulator 2 n=1 Tax=Nilaparvata lugens TaxID=108931 RepID=UPI00193CE8B8|nr:interferon-related developmental regulator 2 [Nilaparvata lugens]